MANFEPGSPEYNLLVDRVKMGCGAQSRQIDKTKIGENVKGIPTIWKQYQRYSPDDTEEVKKKKDFYNSILVDKKPYFFRYKYNTLNKEYNDYIRKIKEDCEIRFTISFDELQKIPEDKLTDEQIEFLRLYHKYLPVVDSNCVMNRICKYIESIDFNIKSKVRSSQGFDYQMLTTLNFRPNKIIYSKISKIMEDTFHNWKYKKKDSKLKDVRVTSNNADISKEKFDRDVECSLLKLKLEEVCSNEEQLANHLIYLFYVDKPGYNKNILWNLVGKQIYENIKSKTTSYYFPKKNPNGSLKYLYENYSIERIMLPVDEGVEIND